MRTRTNQHETKWTVVSHKGGGVLHFNTHEAAVHAAFEINGYIIPPLYNDYYDPEGY